MSLLLYDPRGPEAYNVELIWDSGDEVQEKSVWDKHDGQAVAL